MNGLIERAFLRLAARPGFQVRADQQQIALLLADMIGEGNSAMIEAPTGLGKSLATLIPAIAHGIVTKKRVVIATYTNVLAEQYWYKDLPLALSLFDESDLEGFNAQLQMGRSRYACLIAMDDVVPNQVDIVLKEASQGIESELRKLIKVTPKAGARVPTWGKTWSQISTPPVCPARLCPAYDSCFYYSARRKSEAASLVITNHSVVIQDALQAVADEEGEGMLGKVDFIVLDEAHDFPSAAINGLEFELSLNRLGTLIATVRRLDAAVQPLAQALGAASTWAQKVANFVRDIEGKQRGLMGFALELGRPGILEIAPSSLIDHPAVKQARIEAAVDPARIIADEVADVCDTFADNIHALLADWKTMSPEKVRPVQETIRNYLMYVREFGVGCKSIMAPQGASVSYVSQNREETLLRQDVTQVAEPLKRLIWDRVPYACLSATLLIDDSFDSMTRSLGVTPTFYEALPSPFDFERQAALYLPPPGTIPDATIARKEGSEEYYYRKLAEELSMMITALQGRTLALFHSRRELEGVLKFIDISSDLPIFVQPSSGAGGVGERFKDVVHSSLFALRSFWTGFDAPGETLSCVALVRVPFEVPVEPPQIARLAYLQSQGLDPFREHTLAQAKMLMRQGAGRLIRSQDDKGIIALLDARLQTKRYGEEILNNLPHGMRRYSDFYEAIAHLGLEG